MKLFPRLVSILTLGALVAGTPGPAPAHDQDAGVEPAPAAVPRLLHYQVRLAEVDGVPLEGTVKLAVRIYSALEGGALLWSETHNGVPLTDGVASVLLGSLVTIPADTFDGTERYLGLSVNDGDEMTPRLRVGAVPYAMEASRLNGKTSADFEPKGAVLALAINDGSPPNSGTNRLHWNNLVGVPEGFADGEDQGLEAHGDLTGLDADDHPQYALESDLESSGGSGPNGGKDLVHWENLVGVPSGFADGADNTGAGITAHGDLSGLDADDHPQYATDANLIEHTSNQNIHGRTTNASDLTSGFLSPDRIQNGSLDGSAIQNGSLSAEKLSDESGLAFNSAAGEDSLTALSQDLLTVSLTCPSVGFVLVTGTAQACADSGAVSLDAVFSVSDQSGVLNAVATRTFALTVDPDGDSCLPVTSQTVFPVTPGLQTFYLVAESSVAGVRASQYTLSAVFLPTQY